MKYDIFDVIAPGRLQQTFNEAEALGSAVWLWMHSPFHREFPLHTLPRLILPAIKRRQFVLAAENGKPVFYLSWAMFSEEAEQRYISRPLAEMQESDWGSGNRMWVLDWIAPFGHSIKLRKLVLRLLHDCCFRGLPHHNNENRSRVSEFRGITVMPKEARAWFALHPVRNRMPSSSI